jgi:rubrerythrin
MNTNPALTDSNLSSQDRKRILIISESNWQAEMRGFETYSALAERETDPQRSAAFHTLADAEQRHADLWAGRINVLGGSQLTYGGPKTGQADILANRIGGLDMTLRRLELEESEDIAKYAKQIDAIHDQPSIVILRQVLQDEREHYQILNNLIRNRRPLTFSPDHARKALDELLALRQAGSPKAAGWIGDAIYGPTTAGGLRNRISMSYGAMCSVTDSSRVLMPFQTIWAPIQTRRNDESFVITDIPVGPRTRASRSANP